MYNSFSESYNLRLHQNIKKLNLIFNIYLEKQLFFFIYLYLFFFKRINLIFKKSQYFNIFSDFLVKFCNKFHFSLLVNGCNILNRIYSIYQSKIALLNIIISNKKKLLKSKCKLMNIRSLVPNLEFKDFYFIKFFKFGKKIYSSYSLDNRQQSDNLVEKFKNFSFTMLRIFKLKVIFSIFFRIRYQFSKNLKFISFLGLRRFYSSINAINFFFKRSLKFGRKLKYFTGKYFNKVKYVKTISNLSSRLLQSGVLLKGMSYFISKIIDKFSIGKKLYILTTGRCIIFRFSKKLNIPIPFKYTKYKKLNINFIKYKFNLNFNLIFLKKLNKLYKNNLILKSEYRKKIKSTNYFIRNPIQKLIVSGRKKLGFNIFNNLFLVLSKLFKKPILNHIEIVNNVYRKLFIRATVKNIERNKSFLGVRQSASILMGYEELKSRVNLFFFDYMNSLSRKKTKRVRIRKVKDLIFSDFFNISLIKNSKKQKSHLSTVFTDIYNFMFKELTFRGTKIIPYRSRIIKILKTKKKHKFNRLKRIKILLKFKLKKKIKKIRKKQSKFKRKKYTRLKFKMKKIFKRKLLKLKREEPEDINLKLVFKQRILNLKEAFFKSLKKKLKKIKLKKVLNLKKRVYKVLRKVIFYFKPFYRAKRLKKMSKKIKLIKMKTMSSKKKKKQKQVKKKMNSLIKKKTTKINPIKLYYIRFTNKLKSKFRSYRENSKKLQKHEIIYKRNRKKFNKFKSTIFKGSLYFAKKKSKRLKKKLNISRFKLKIFKQQMKKKLKKKYRLNIRRLKKKIKLMLYFKNIKEKIGIIKNIKKNLKMKIFTYIEDILTRGLARTTLVKEVVFVNKCNLILNKYFIYNRLVSFAYPKNKSAITLLKIKNNLGTRSAHVLRSCYIVKDKILKEITYSIKKFKKKCLLLSFNNIIKCKNMFLNFRENPKTSYFRSMRRFFKRNKFLNFIFFKSINKIYYKKELRDYEQFFLEKLLVDKLEGLVAYTGLELYDLVVYFGINNNKYEI